MRSTVVRKPSEANLSRLSQADSLYPQTPDNNGRLAVEVDSSCESLSRMAVLAACRSATSNRSKFLVMMPHGCPQKV